MSYVSVHGTRQRFLKAGPFAIEAWVHEDGVVRVPTYATRPAIFSEIYGSKPLGARFAVLKPPGELRIVVADLPATRVEGRLIEGSFLHEVFPDVDAATAKLSALCRRGMLVAE